MIGWCDPGGSLAAMMKSPALICFMCNMRRQCVKCCGMVPLGSVVGAETASVCGTCAILALMVLIMYSSYPCVCAGSRSRMPGKCCQTKVAGK